MIPHLIISSLQPPTGRDVLHVPGTLTFDADFRVLERP